MKNLITVFIIVLFANSCANKLTNNIYTSVEPWKEWEIELRLNKDSTFTLTDRFGCNNFYYSGQWHYNKDNIKSFIILSDTTKSEYVKSHDMYRFFNRTIQKEQVVRADQYFPVITSDTIWILNNRQMSFRKLIFDKQRSSNNKDLSKERVKMIENFYVHKIGRELFIKSFGNGGGIEEARKNISECKNDPISNIAIGQK